MKDLSISITGLRINRWKRLIESTIGALGNYSYEIILTGPYEPSKEVLDIPNVKFVKHDGSPSETVQFTSTIADARFFTLLADDADCYPNTIAESLDLLLSKNPDKDLIAIRHIQTNNYNGITEGFSQRSPEWWLAYTHPILRQKHVDSSWLITCNPLMSLEYYKYLGGIDTRFYHVNYNIHDLSFRAQKNGSKVYISPNIVMNTPTHNDRPNTDKLVINTINNDEPLFVSTWSNERSIRI